MGYHFIKFWLLLHDRNRDNLLWPGYGYVPGILKFAQLEWALLDRVLSTTIPLTWIRWRAMEASWMLWGESKHLAVEMLALTIHCRKSCREERKRCSSSFSLFWHSREARRLRLGRKMHRAVLEKERVKKGGWGLKWVSVGGPDSARWADICFNDRFSQRESLGIRKWKRSRTYTHKNTVACLHTDTHSHTQMRMRLKWAVGRQACFLLLYLKSMLTRQSLVSWQVLSAETLTLDVALWGAMYHNLSFTSVH